MKKFFATYNWRQVCFWLHPAYKWRDWTECAISCIVGYIRSYLYNYVIPLCTTNYLTYCVHFRSTIFMMINFIHGVVKKSLHTKSYGSVLTMHCAFIIASLVDGINSMMTDTYISSAPPIIMWLSVGDVSRITLQRSFEKYIVYIQSSASFFSWHHMVYCYMRMAHFTTVKTKLDTQRGKSLW